MRLIDAKLNSLDQDHWLKLMTAVKFVGHRFGSDRRDIKIDPTAISDSLSDRTIVAISTRVSAISSNMMFLKYMQEYGGDDSVVLQWCLQEAINSASRHPENWRNFLPIVSRSYAKSRSPDQHFGYRLFRILRAQELPYEIAEAIIQNCENYPLKLIDLAEGVCRQHVAEKVVPVGLVAKQQ